MMAIGVMQRLSLFDRSSNILANNHLLLFSIRNDSLITIICG